MKLVPVEHDPFAIPEDGIKLVPVKGDPFASVAPESGWWDVISNVPAVTLEGVKQAGRGIDVFARSNIQALGAEAATVAPSTTPLPTPELEQASRKQAVTEYTTKQKAFEATQPKFPASSWKGTVSSALSSVLLNVPSIAAGIALKSPAVALAPLGIQQGLQDYGEAMTEGKGQGTAAVRGIVSGASEVGTELIGFRSLMKAIDLVPGGLKAKFVKQVAKAIGQDLLGEQINTIIQDHNYWATGKYDEENLGAKDFYAKLGNDLKETLAVTAIASPLTAGLGAGIGLGAHKLARKSGVPTPGPIHGTIPEEKTGGSTISSVDSQQTPPQPQDIVGPGPGVLPAGSARVSPVQATQDTLVEVPEYEDYNLALSGKYGDILQKELADYFNNEPDVMSATLKELTTWANKEGRVFEGKTDISKLSDHMAQVALGKFAKLKKEATKAEQAQANEPLIQDDVPDFEPVSGEPATPTDMTAVSAKPRTPENMLADVQGGMAEADFVRSYVEAPAELGLDYGDPTAIDLLKESVADANRDYNARLKAIHAEGKNQGVTLGKLQELAKTDGALNKLRVKKELYQNVLDGISAAKKEYNDIKAGKQEVKEPSNYVLPPTEQSLGTAPIPQEKAGLPPKTDDLGAASPDAVKSKSSPSFIEGKETVAYTPDNKPYTLKYAILPISKLVASNKEGGAVNPDYPKQYQPRDRDRIASQLQINDIVQKPIPEKLLANVSTADGAPIVDTGGVVLSGNGRVIAMQIVQRSKEGTRQADWKRYTDVLREKASEFGLSPDTIQEDSLLVRVKTDDSDNLDFVRQSNKPIGLSMSPVEDAKQDSRLINPDILPEDGDIRSAGALKFVRDFISHLPNNERANLVTPEGTPTRQLYDRLQNAVFQYAYGDERLLSMVAEETNPDIKIVINALTLSAKDFAKARAKGGDFADMVKHITDDVHIYREAKSNGLTVRESLAQESLFGEEQKNISAGKIADIIEQNTRSAKKLAGFLRDIVGYYNRQTEEARYGDVDMFGEKKPKLTQKEVIENARKNMEDTRQNKLFKREGVQAKPEAVETGRGGRETNEGDISGGKEVARKGLTKTLPNTPAAAAKHVAIYNGKEVESDTFKDAAMRIADNIKVWEHGYVLTPSGQLFEIAGDKKTAVRVKEMRTLTEREIALLKTRIEKSTSQQEKETLSKRLDALVSKNQQGLTRFQAAAYHGSPHTFDKFSTDKIGAGEGAQSYGYGLYFATSKVVAEWYKNRLSSPVIWHKKQKYSAHSRDAHKQVFYRTLQLIINQDVENVGVATALQRAIKNLENQVEKARAEDSSWISYNYSLFTAEQQLATLKHLSANDITSKRGHLYEVELAPKEDEYLIWEKPLKEQSAHVREKLKNENLGDDLSGQRIYKQFAEKRGDKAASEYLHSLGIRGIKYLDGISRAKGEGDYNYVIFSSDDVEIKARFQAMKGGQSVANIPPSQAITQEIERMVGMPIEVNFKDKIIASDYGVKQADDTVIRGAYTRLSEGKFRAVIDLSLSDMDSTTAPHEAFHAAQDFLLNEDERALLFDKYPALEDESSLERQAEAFAKYYNSKRSPLSVASRVKQVFDKIINFFEGMKSYLNGQGFKTADDVFKAFESGELAERAIQVSTSEGAQFQTAIRKSKQEQGELRAGIDYGAAPLSTRLAQVDETLRDKIRMLEYGINRATQKDQVIAESFAEELLKLKKKNAADFESLDIALKNRDVETRDAILAKHPDLKKLFEKIPAMLDDVYARALDVGIDLGYLENYYPRMVRNVDKYMEKLRGSDKWGDLLVAQADYEKKIGRTLTEAETAEFFNRLLNGYSYNGVKLPSFVKTRAVDQLNAELNEFYYDSIEVLPAYIRTMNENIVMREWLGKGDNLENSIGDYVRKLIADGYIRPQDEKEVRQLIKVRVNPKNRGELAAAYTDIIYIFSLSSFKNALRQLQDLGILVYRHGLINTTRHFAPALFNKSKITMEDIGVHEISPDISIGRATQKWLDLQFKLTRFSSLDRMMKEIDINASWATMQKKVAKGDKVFEAELRRVFGEEWEIVRDDIKAGNLTEAARYLLFARLAEWQPLARSEFPEGYVAGGNARLFYALKSFQIKQLDYMRNECFLHKDPKRGAYNFVKLVSILALSGVSNDMIIRFILGKDYDLSDMAVDNLLRLFGFSRYSIYQMRNSPEEGILQFFAPPIMLLPDLWKDAKDMFSPPKRPQRGIPRRGVSDLRTWRKIPVVGEFYYNWFGGGLIDNAKYKKRKLQEDRKEARESQ